MGWKASMIIINPRVEVDMEKLLHDLGFKKLKKINDQPLDDAIYPNDDEVYIGIYEDNLLICASDLPMMFFDEHINEIEKIFLNRFPDSEVCSIVLQSTVNLWGYSILKNGNKFRTRAGSADDGTFIDVGEPLEQEKALFAKSTVDTRGNRMYKFEDLPGELLTEDQVGENFVFEICGRYFGESLDSADELLFDTVMTGYKFQK